MFRKLISNLPFNPSLINQVSFYGKRLHQEQSIRRIGLGLVALAMFLQMFAVLSPPEQSYARVGNDIVPNGVKFFPGDDQAKQGELVNHCNRSDPSDFPVILEYFGVHCVDLFYGHVQTINSRDYGGQLYSMGRAPYGKQDEKSVEIPGAGTYYMRPLWSWDTYGSSNYKAIVGTRSDGSPFMILFDCGNLVIVGPPPKIEKPEKSLACSNLIMDGLTSGQEVAMNTTVNVRGEASGTNLPQGELVHMYYDFVNANSPGTVLGTDEADGVPFSGPGTALATDTTNRSFTLAKSGHYLFRLSVTYNNNGTSAAATGNQIGNCVKELYVQTKPDVKPKKVIECNTLIAQNLTNEIITGTTVSVRGRASGRNLPENEMADMYYDYIDDSGRQSEVQKAEGNVFKDGFAEDNIPRSFKLEKPGVYTFRLAVKYDGSTKEATGNRTGDCIKKVTVKQPCAEDKTGKDDTQCLILSKKARNTTRGKTDADGTIAYGGDVIVYSLITKNTSKNTTVKNYVIKENMIDVLQYADIINFGGGKKDKYGVVAWPAIDIKAGETITKTITIKIVSPIRNTPSNPSDPGSYDMKLTNIYGNAVNIKLPPSVVKSTEYVAKQLPNTGPGETLAGGFAIISIVGYFFMRSRLLGKEVDIIREEYATSGSA